MCVGNIQYLCIIMSKIKTTMKDTVSSPEEIFFTKTNDPPFNYPNILKLLAAILFNFTGTCSLDLWNTYYTMRHGDIMHLLMENFGEIISLYCRSYLHNATCASIYDVSEYLLSMKTTNGRNTNTNATFGKKPTLLHCVPIYLHQLDDTIIFYINKNLCLDLIKGVLSLNHLILDENIICSTDQPVFKNLTEKKFALNAQLSANQQRSKNTFADEGNSSTEYTPSTSGAKMHSIAKSQLPESWSSSQQRTIHDIVEANRSTNKSPLMVPFDDDSLLRSATAPLVANSFSQSGSTRDYGVLHYKRLAHGLSPQLLLDKRTAEFNKILHRQQNTIVENSTFINDLGSTSNTFQIKAQQEQHEQAVLLQQELEYVHTLMYRPQNIDHTITLLTLYHICSRALQEHCVFPINCGSIATPQLRIRFDRAQRQGTTLFTNQRIPVPATTIPLSTPSAAANTKTYNGSLSSPSLFTKPCPPRISF